MKLGIKNKRQCQCGGRLAAFDLHKLKCLGCDMKYPWEDYRAVCESWEDYYRVKSEILCRLTEWHNRHGPGWGE